MNVNFSRLLLSAALALAVLVSARAESIAFISGNTILTTNSSQLGRPSRNSQPQTWTYEEAYPGILASTTATTYYYKTYDLAASLFTGAPYVDISFTDDNVTGLLFISAYANSYNVNNRAANWLGDLGYNSIAYGANSLYFDVVLPANSDLILVVNTTGGGTSGTGQPYDIAVNAYADTMYDDPVPTPEPASWIMTATGLLAILVTSRRHLFRRA